MNLQHSSPHRAGSAPPVGGRARVPSWFWATLAFAFIGTLFFASYLIYVTVRDYVATQQSFSLSDSVIPSIATPEPDATPMPEPPRWSGHDRVNVLLTGIDQREIEEGPWRTDTMMVLTIDPVTMSAGMLSIPRDLWVPIYGYEEQNRINTAHYYGDVYGYPGGGPALARDTVMWNLGVPIHFYVRINFTAFETLIDEIGGIDVYVPETIDDPYYPDEAYGYDPFYIEAGWQHMDGKIALRYARTRATFGGDFDRGQRQQAVILGVRDKVVSLNQLPRLIAKAPTLMNTLGDAVRTDMGLEQAIQLAQLASEIDPDRIFTAVIDHHYTSAQETPDGAQVLIPNRESMRELRDLFFSGPQVAGGVTTLAERLAQENARIIVLNGSNTAGLARRTSDHLSEQGFQVVEVGDASTLYENTLIIDYASKHYTSKQLVALLKLPLSSVVSGSDPEGDYDVMLILGNDFELPGGSDQRSG
jgi:LCP family protein required for cell wall assembly